MIAMMLTLSMLAASLADVQGDDDDDTSEGPFRWLATWRQSVESDGTPSYPT